MIPRISMNREHTALGRSRSRRSGFGRLDNGPRWGESSNDLRIGERVHLIDRFPPISIILIIVIVPIVVRLAKDAGRNEGLVVPIDVRTSFVVVIVVRRISWGG